MDIIFSCQSCRQQLEADSSMAGQAIQCPACNAKIVIPQPDPTNVKVGHASHTSAASKEHKTFSVPVHDKPAESLIKKPNAPLEASAKEPVSGEKKIRIRCIKRTECMEVGHDAFDQRVTEFLQHVGEANVVSISTINYSHIDMGSRQLLNDYGVLIVYRG